MQVEFVSINCYSQNALNNRNYFLFFATIGHVCSQFSKKFSLPDQSWSMTSQSVNNTRSEVSSYLAQWLCQQGTWQQSVCHLSVSAWTGSRTAPPPGRSCGWWKDRCPLAGISKHKVTKTGLNLNMLNWMNQTVNRARWQNQVCLVFLTKLFF